MFLKVKETIFFYNIEGVLRQAVEVEIDPAGYDLKSVDVEIKTHGHGSAVTRIRDLMPGVNKVTCYAPVVFPNFISGKHRPVPAEIILKSDGRIYKDEIIIGRRRPWTIYICQDICTDFTWGLPDEQTKEESAAMIRKQLDFMDLTDSERHESKNRWNVNQTMEIDWFLQDADETAIRKLFEREKEGRVQISAVYNSNLTAMLSTEQAIRSLYFARELEKKWGIDLSTVEHIEMPTITWGMMSIFANAGIKYFSKAWLDFNSHHLRKSTDVPLFYWQGPDGNSVLTFMDRGANLKGHYGQASFLIQKEYPQAVEELHEWWIPHYENNEAYPFDTFMMQGAYIDLHATSKFEVERLVKNIIRYNNEPWEYPRIINATWKQYFESVLEFSSKNGIEIPEISGDMGASWEDWPAHYAHIVSRLKRGTEDFITAEKIAALKSALSGKTNKADIDTLHYSVDLMNRLAEHPWNGTNDDEKYRSLGKRSRWTDELIKNNKKIIVPFSGFSKPGTGTGGNLYKVFNPLSWSRTDLLELDMECPGQYPYRVDDNDDTMTGSSTGFQVIDEFGVRKIVTAVANVPSMGYKQISLCNDNMAVVPKISIKDNTIENGFYRISVNRLNGSIESLWDKKNDCELVDRRENLGLNQFIYQSDGNIHRAEDVKISAVNCGPLRSSLLVEAQAYGCSLTSIITLYGDIDKISIKNKLVKKPSREPQNIYFAFPFDIPDREYHYECCGSIIKPGLKEYGGDNLPGSGQEIYCVRNFIDVSNSKRGVVLSPLDSYLFQLGGFTYDIMPDFPNRNNSTVYSLVMTNHAYAEILRDQGGNEEFFFGYALSTHKGGYNPAQAIKFGWEANNAIMRIGCEEGFEKAVFEDVEKSFIECRTDNVIVTAFKNSEDDSGDFIIRIWEIEGKDTIAEIDISGLGFSRAIGCDILERENGKAPEISSGILHVPVSAMGIETIKLKK